VGIGRERIQTHRHTRRELSAGVGGPELKEMLSERARGRGYLHYSVARFSSPNPSSRTGEGGGRDPGGGGIET
jgi:hypothetical protein